MSVGIVSYGSYIPSGRKKVESQKMRSSLLVNQKAIAGPDEDAATIAIAAAEMAIKWPLNLNIGAVYVGSESHPYAVKPTAGIVGAALGLSKNYMAADLEFACKAGTAALQICYGLVKAGMTEHALAIGSDVAQAAPGDVLEYSAAAGGAAFVVGSENLIASIDETISITTDTPDFWRRQLQPYPSHTNRFTGEPSYFAHVIEATETILNKTGLVSGDFSHVVFHQPNGKFPRIAAKRLGFTEEQISAGMLVGEIGNTYSASSLLGLCAALDVAKSGEKILLVSYGSGAGSDAFVLGKI